MAEKWIQGAIKKPGLLHRDLHVPQGQKIPAAKILKAAHSTDPTLRRRAILAQTLKSMHRPR
jgi:hypothetical protein